MKKKQFKKLMAKLDAIHSNLEWIEKRMPPLKTVEYKPYKPLTTVEEYLLNRMNHNGDDQPCPPQPKGTD